MQTQPSFKGVIQKVLDIYEDLLDKYETEEEFNKALEERFLEETPVAPALIKLTSGKSKLTYYCYSKPPTSADIVNDEYLQVSQVLQIIWPALTIQGA